MGVCRFAFYIRDLEHPCILVPVGGCVGNMCLGLPAISERGWGGGREVEAGGAEVQGHSQV